MNEPEYSADYDALTQVWCVVYDSPTPSMDGGVHPIRMAEQSMEQAERNYAFMLRQQRVAPKRNLRIETRFVTEWTRDIPPVSDEETA